MRRKEREIKNPEEIKDVLDKSFALHLGINDDGHIYVVPVNFGYKVEKVSGNTSEITAETTPGNQSASTVDPRHATTPDCEKYTFYFHGAKAGRKFNLLKNGALVGFECETDFSLLEGEKACDYSAFYASVIGEGKVSLIEDNDEKKSALNLIMKKACGKDDWNYPAAMLAGVAVFKLEVLELSCKKHKR